MFTGLIQHLGSVLATDPTSTGITLRINCARWAHQPEHGASIAVNGCCLTVKDHTPAADELRFDVIHQTLRVTTLGDLKAGDAVNLESSVTPSTMLGGHIVQGHVDGIAQVVAINRDGGEHRVRISPPTELMHCIIEKGSVAVDGVSLTVASVGDDWFEVALIPTTLQLTTFGSQSVGDRVNIETDYIAKIVARQLAVHHCS